LFVQAMRSPMDALEQDNVERARETCALALVGDPCLSSAARLSPDRRPEPARLRSASRATLGP